MFLTFFAAVLAFVTLASIVLFATAERHDAGWVEAADAVVEAHKPALLAALAGEGDLEAATGALAGALELRVAVRSPDGAHLAGDPATPPLRPLRPRQRSRLERGAPVMLREKSGEPQLAFPIGDRAILIADTGDHASRRMRTLVLGVVGLVGLLGASAWLLARSLTRRLALLEDGAARIARGELGHRVQVDPRGDEIDRLGQEMNDMAYQLGELIRGQRSLLTNVSHELKTPIARLRVLAELLTERAETLPEHPRARGSARARSSSSRTSASWPRSCKTC
ncbi:HAMP domain-containing protein [Nannocystis pusilla]|uniref:HAMP domain-containing protein n=1 Tax=Nannocystis pusilla TaxID=889268 RepID=UPI003B7F34DA